MIPSSVSARGFLLRCLPTVEVCELSCLRPLEFGAFQLLPEVEYGVVLRSDLITETLILLLERGGIDGSSARPHDVLTEELLFLSGSTLPPYRHHRVVRSTRRRRKLVRRGAGSRKIASTHGQGIRGPHVHMGIVRRAHGTSRRRLSHAVEGRPIITMGQQGGMAILAMPRNGDECRWHRFVLGVSTRRKRHWEQYMWMGCARERDYW